MNDAFGETARKGLRPLLEVDVHLASLLERALLLRSWTSDSPSLFILGLPRSGTTLVYQYIVHRLTVAYFTNGVGRYYLAPCLATWAQHTLHPTYRSDFTSDYGSVSGAMAPHEAGRFWGRFFGFEEYITPNQVSPQDRRLMRRTIAFVQRLFGDVPFVNKNVKHILRLPALHAVFPNALFLRVQRDRTDVALSLLRARHDNLDDPTNWWSARPPNYRALQHLPLDEQIARQLAVLDEKMDADLSALPSEQVLSIDYQTFCACPDDFIQSIQSRLPRIQYRNEKVEQFPPSTNTPQSDQEEQLVQRIKSLDPS